MGVAENISTLLRTYGITQADLAKIADVDKSTVSYWLKGNRRPREDAIRRICNHFNLYEDDILSDYYGLAGESKAYECVLGRPPTRKVFEQIRLHSMDPQNVDEVVSADVKTVAGWMSARPQDAEMLRTIRSFAGKPVPGMDVTFSGLPVIAGAPATVPLVTLGRVHAGPLSEEEAVEEEVEVPASVLEHHPRAQALVVDGDCMDRFALPGMAVVFDPDLTPGNGSVAIVETEDHEAVMRRWYRGGDTLLLVADSHGDYPDIVLRWDDGPISVLGVVVWVQSAGELL